MPGRATLPQPCGATIKMKVTATRSLVCGTIRRNERLSWRPQAITARSTIVSAERIHTPLHKQFWCDPTALLALSPLSADPACRHTCDS